VPRPGGIERRRQRQKRRRQQQCPEGWTNEAGPRQSRKVFDWLKRINTLAHSWRDARSGCRCSCIPAELTSPEVAKLYQELGGRHGWRITRANHKQILEDAIATESAADKVLTVREEVIQ
jgi:hypothetical protein